MSESPANKVTGRWQLEIVAAMLVLAAIYFYQDPEWNGNSRLDLTRAMVEERSLRIDGYESDPNWATGDKALYAGHYFSDKAIGSSVLAVPFYFVLYKASTLAGFQLGSTFVKHILTSLVLGGAFTLCGLAMYLIALQITNDAARALVPMLAVAFGTMLWPYSAVYYGHVIAAALLIWAFYILFSTRVRLEGASYGRLVWAGLAMGFAFITEYTSALIILGLVAYAAYALRRRGGALLLRFGAAVMAGTLIPLTLASAYNVGVYGSVFATGYAFEAQQGFREGMSLGLMGVHLPSLANTYHITFDPQFGVFWQSPVLLLAAAGFYVALRDRQYRAEAIMCLSAITVMIAMNGGYYLWWGGSAFGPRLMIPGLPFFILPLAVLPRRMNWPLVLLGLVSAAQMLIPLMGQIQPTKLAFRPRPNMFFVADRPFTGFSLLYDYGLPEISRRYAAGAQSWHLGTGLGLPYWMGVPVLVAAESALMAVFLKRGQSTRPPYGTAGAPTEPSGSS
jgi:hypothetical protein